MRNPGVELSSPSTSENVTSKVIHTDCSGCQGDSERGVCTGATPASLKGQRPAPVSRPSAGRACPPPAAPRPRPGLQPSPRPSQLLLSLPQNAEPAWSRVPFGTLLSGWGPGHLGPHGVRGQRWERTVPFFGAVPDSGVNLTDLSLFLHICSYPDRRRHLRIYEGKQAMRAQRARASWKAEPQTRPEASTLQSCLKGPGGGRGRVGTHSEGCWCQDYFKPKT